MASLVSVHDRSGTPLPQTPPEESLQAFSGTKTEKKVSPELLMNAKISESLELLNQMMGMSSVKS